MQDGRPARQEQAILLPDGDARPPWHFQPVHFPGDGRL